MGSPISAATLVAKGFRQTPALKKHTNAWGTKGVAAGAGDGLEIDSHSMVPAVSLIQNDAASGPISRRPGVKGNELVAGDIGPCPFYYRGLEVPFGLAFGTAGVPTVIAGTANLHKFRLANTHKGLYASFVVDPFGSDAGADGAIHEYPFVKILGFKLECEQNGMAKITFPAAAWACQYNVGTPDPVTVVASVQPANGARTIANQPGKARNLHVRITDADVSITEYVLTFVGTDRNGATITEVYTKSVNTLLWTSTKAFRTVTTITASALAGTATGDTLEIFTAPVVRRLTPANGAMTLDTQPYEPTQLLISVTDANSSVTEFVVTIVGTNPDGNGITEVYTLSKNGGPGSHTFITNQVFATVTTITGSALAGSAAAGTDFIQVDCANGVNNRNTIANVTYPTDRDLAVFGQVEVLINDQAAGALTTADIVNNLDNDEYYVSKLSVEMNLNANTEDVTSRFGTRVEEPISGGKDFADTKFSLGFSKYDTRDHEQLKRQLSKKPQKAKITFTGPLISGGSGNAFKLEIYLNNIQFDSGAPTQSGAGVMPFDLSGMAYQASAVPTGFPASMLQPIGIDLTTTLTTDPLA